MLQWRTEGGEWAGHFRWYTADQNRFELKAMQPQKTFSAMPARFGADWFWLARLTAHSVGHSLLPYLRRERNEFLSVGVC